MDLREVRDIIGEHAGKSDEYARIETASRHIADWFTREFSIIRVDRVGHAVTSNEVSECLSWLLNKDEAERCAHCAATWPASQLACDNVKTEIKEGELKVRNETNRKRGDSKSATITKVT